MSGSRGRRKNREGSYRRRPDGLIEYRVTFPNGQRRSFYARTERAAKRKADDALRDYEDGLTRRGEKLTVADYMRDWLDTTAQDRVRPSTLRSYRSLTEHHIIPAIGHIRLRELDATDVNRMLAGIVRGKASPTTGNRVRATLRTALASAVKARMIRDNAAALSDPRTERKARIEPLTADQARKLLEVTRDDWMGPLLTVALATGLRQGELLALRWQDIDLDLRFLSVSRTLTWQSDGDGTRRAVFSDPKTPQSRRRVPLTTQAIEAFTRQRDVVIELEQKATVARWRPLPGEDLVFVSTVGTPLNGVNVTHRVQKIMERAGLPRKRFHDLRHSTAALLLSQGVDIFTVKEILGHSQITLTANTYGHLTDELAEDAASRLEALFSPTTPNITPDVIDSGDIDKGADQ